VKFCKYPLTINLIYAVQIKVINNKGRIFIDRSLSDLTLFLEFKCLFFSLIAHQLNLFAVSSLFPTFRFLASLSLSLSISKIETSHPLSFEITRAYNPQTLPPWISWINELHDWDQSFLNKNSLHSSSLRGFNSPSAVLRGFSRLGSTLTM
jgi:hypothetical protein